MLDHYISKYSDDTVKRAWLNCKMSITARLAGNTYHIFAIVYLGASFLNITLFNTGGPLHAIVFA